MLRTILTYGLIAGLVIIAGMIVSMTLMDRHGSATMVVGYLIMLVGLSSILVAVKQHRDQALGGVIRFRTAFGLGLGIAFIAALAYVAVWEVYLVMTDYAFMTEYTQAMLAAKREAGITGEAYAKAQAEMEAMREMYKNPLMRLPMTFAEIFPVGLLVALVSAGLLRNPKFLPARSRPIAA